MNPFSDLSFMLRLAKMYLSDVNRLWNFNEEQLKRYQDNQFRRIVNYAYTVPMYHEKYKKHGIHPRDIQGIDDINKLPFITKDDLRNNYPAGITPKNLNPRNSFTVSTSGSTGKPVFVVIDRLSALKSLLGFVRALKAYGGNWRKSKVVLIIDTEPGSAENAFFIEKIPVVSRLFKLENIKYLHLGEKPEKIMKILNEFQPDYLGSDPNMLRQLAYLKEQGQGKQVNPDYILSSGSMLDDYTKQYVELAYGRRVLDAYGTTEGGPLSFECIEGDYHVHSDFVKIEFLDEEDQPVPLNTAGHTVITKLYGAGTPIIRYKGIDDIATPIKKKTSCGITSDMIKKIEGRASELIYLPDGKTLSPLAVTGIPAKTMEYFNSYKITHFQIIQHQLDDIEIKVVIDEKKNPEISSEKIIAELKKRFEEKIGPEVTITVTQKDEIKNETQSHFSKVIVSKLSNK
jgi:phenylacetate-CoA ligase